MFNFNCCLKKIQKISSFRCCEQHMHNLFLNPTKKDVCSLFSMKPKVNDFLVFYFNQRIKDENQRIKDAQNLSLLIPKMFPY